MNYRFTLLLLGVLACAPAQPQPANQPLLYHAEALPGYIVARTEVRDRFLAELPPSTHGFSPQFVIETIKRWDPGATVRVAFSGGNNALRKKVVDAAGVWSAAGGNVKLDFGANPAAGTFRSWSTTDVKPVAEVRISFNQSGYWSVVGRDSMDPTIVSPSEASMNFGGFAGSLPPDYAAVVAHEFGHAFGFQHEHQSPVGGCDAQFRWFDDPQYEPTRDQFGQYMIDSRGRRPGIYTVLGGPPNNWEAAKVDHNLKQLPNSSAFSLGQFDAKSIMMYSFPDWMFVSPQSKCHTGENLVLSAQDIVGFKQAYPSAAPDIVTQLNLKREFLETVLNAPSQPASNKARLQLMLDAIH